ncbi:RNA polymerase II-associated protein 3 [Taenia crassiceps]|uniref:RNA polymerase II-associated protein 3 n=1 Tax=Taenia crassiceps TaxID=6207 RepID=A0ABR4QTK9_9CEST
MDERRFIEMRKQIEENNQEVRDFLGNMDQWRMDVERKSAKLRSEAESQNDLPQIRNVLHKKKKKRPNPNRLKVASSSRIKSDDYAAWDSFDVDKALEAIDKPEKEETSGESETDEEWENERRARLADIEKEQGNICFKESKYEEAVVHYTSAIRLAPENPLLYSNRALALCKLERFASAEADCSTALTINPKLVKALYRRAHARKALGKLDEAISDLKRVLDIEARNSAALKDLSAWTGDSNLCAGSINSIFKIIDISGVSPNDLHLISILEAGGSRSMSQVDDNADLRIPDLRVTSGDNFLIPCVSSHLALTPTVPTEPPTNWFQMERELRELIPSSQSLGPPAVDYLCSIDPSNYMNVIGNNLNPSCLSRLLAAFSMSSKLTSVQKAERMAALAKLPRFDVAWLLTDDAGREIVKQLLQEVPSDSVASLKTYFV